MSMWKKLRKEYTNYTLKDIGEILGVSKQAVGQYESGKLKMPVKVQLMYLGFRNNDIDKVIINYLKELV